MAQVRSLYRILHRTARLHDDIPSLKFLIRWSLIDRQRTMPSEIPIQEQLLSEEIKTFLDNKKNYMSTKSLREFVESSFRKTNINNVVDNETRIDVGFAALRLLTKNIHFNISKYTGLDGQLDVEDVKSLKGYEDRKLTLSNQPNKGSLLVTYPQLRDRLSSSMFSLSVVLLATDVQGPEVDTVRGYIINYPSPMKFVDMRESRFLDASTSVFDDCHLYKGGPVDIQKIRFLHPYGDLIPESRQIAENIYESENYTGAAKLVLSNQAQVSKFVFVSGIAVWDVEQFKIEFETNNLWICVKSDKVDHFLYADSHFDTFSLQHNEFIKSLAKVIPLNHIPFPVLQRYIKWRYVLKCMGGEFESVSNKFWSVGCLFDHKRINEKNNNKENTQ